MGSKTFLTVCVVFLEEEDSHGQTHDQRSRNGVPAAGKPVLYPLNHTVQCVFWRSESFFSVQDSLTLNCTWIPKTQRPEVSVETFQITTCSANKIRCKRHTYVCNHGLVPTRVIVPEHLQYSKAPHGYEATLQPLKVSAASHCSYFNYRQMQIPSFFTNVQNSVFSLMKSSKCPYRG